MIHAAFVALLLISQTRVVQLPDTEIVRRSNFVIAATVDGFVCYGTKQPLAVRCHRAVRFKEFAELSASRSVDAPGSRREHYAMVGYGRSIRQLENIRQKRVSLRRVRLEWDGCVLGGTVAFDSCYLERNG